MKRFIFFALHVILLSLALNSYAQSGTSEVVALPLRMEAPAGAKKLGNITVGNNATATTCDYEALIDTAKSEARAMGGNMVKITELVAPVFISKCYKIKADVYYADPIPKYDIAGKKGADNAGSSPGNYATIYFYRLKDTTAFVSAYDVHMGDSVIYRAKSRSHDSVRIYKEGPLTLWAKTGQRVELKLDVKTGTNYYVRCGLVKGELVRMVPVLEQVQGGAGEAEYRHTVKTKKDNDLRYLQQIH